MDLNLVIYFDLFCISWALYDTIYNIQYNKVYIS